MKTLHLTLKKKWFDMIDTGGKKEEYREIKPYWETRLDEDVNGKFHEVVEFRNGYRKDSRRMRFKIDDVTIDVGEEAWGAQMTVKCCVYSPLGTSHGNDSQIQKSTLLTKSGIIVHGNLKKYTPIGCHYHRPLNCRNLNPLR